MAKNSLPSVDDVKPSKQQSDSIIESQPKPPSPMRTDLVHLKLSIPSGHFMEGSHVSRNAYLKQIPLDYAVVLKQVSIGLQATGATLRNGKKIDCETHALLYILESLFEARKSTE